MDERYPVIPRFPIHWRDRYNLDILRRQLVVGDLVGLPWDIIDRIRQILAQNVFVRMYRSFVATHGAYEADWPRDTFFVSPPYVRDLNDPHSYRDIPVIRLY